MMQSVPFDKKTTKIGYFIYIYGIYEMSIV